MPVANGPARTSIRPQRRRRRHWGSAAFRVSGCGTRVAASIKGAPWQSAATVACPCPTRRRSVPPAERVFSLSRPPTAEAPPVAAAAGSAPLDADEDLARARVGDDWLPSDAYHDQGPVAGPPPAPGAVAAPAPKPMPISPTALRIGLLVALIGALLVFGLLVGTSLHHSTPLTPITLSDYNMLDLGLNVEQVEAILSDGTARPRRRTTAPATGGSPIAGRIRMGPGCRWCSSTALCRA